MKKSARRRAIAPAGAAERFASVVPRDPWPQVFHPLLLGAAVALVVATPLIPSEAAILGSHVVIIMATLVLTALWLAGCLMEDRPRWHVGPVDALLAVFLALHSISGVIMMHQGHGRPTLNMLWVWVFFGGLFLAVRQLARVSVEQRALVSVLLAMAVSLSAFGVYQRQIIYPRNRADFAADPDRVLESAGEYAPPGSPQRRHFEDRLASTEPTGPFALTNSLAGVLAPSLVLIVGLGTQLWRALVRDKGPESSARVAVGCAGIGVVLACLVLTKSRTAWLATLAGIACLALSRALPRAWLRARYVAAATILLVAVGAVVTLSGGLDREVLTEAPKSVLYRLEYWQATAGMIKDHPWWGCGPGNFKDYYTRYKLPEASETVADPHNFLMEVAATAGIPASAVFVLLLGALLWQPRGTRLPPISPAPHKVDVGTPGPIYAGAVIGLLLAYPAGLAGGQSPLLEMLGVVLPVSLVCLWLLHPWVTHGALPAGVLSVTAGTLLINLLGAGGIAMPGVAGLLWVLAALLLNISENARLTDDGPQVWRWRAPIENRGTIGVAVAAALVIAVLGYTTLYRPVLADHRFQSFLAEAADGRYSASRVVQQCQRAAQEDRWWSEPYEMWAAATQQQWIAQPTAANLTQFDQTLAAAQQRNPQSVVLARQQGDWLLEMYSVSNRQDLLKRTIDAYARAVSLYPNSSLLHAQLAVACQLAGDTQRAWTEADEAWRLDQCMPHEEMKLAHQLLQVPVVPRPSPLAVGPAVGGENAEQIVQDIRRRRGPE